MRNGPGKSSLVTSRTMAHVAVVATMVALAGCAAQNGAPGVPPIGVETAIGAKHLCGLGVSPEIKLANVPATAARYTVRITNVDALLARRWQEEIAATGAVIPEGALKTYRGPCTAQHLVFEHRVEVLAADASGQAVGYGRAYVPVRSLPDVVAQKSRPMLVRPVLLPTPVVVDPHTPQSNDPFIEPSGPPESASPAN